MNLCSSFIFLNKTTNGGSENNLVYSNARELIAQNRKKRYNTSQKRDYETKNKYNQRKCSKWPPFICKHNRTSRKRFSLEFVTISGVIVAKAS
jgi:hypothetical protein